MMRAPQQVLDKKGISIIEIMASTAISAVIGGIIISIVIMAANIYQSVRINSALEHEANRVIQTIIKRYNDFDAQEMNACIITDPITFEETIIPNCVHLRNAYEIGFNTDGTIVLKEIPETTFDIQIKDDNYLYINENGTEDKISADGYYLINSEFGYEDSGIETSCTTCYSGTITITLTLQANVYGEVSSPHTFKTILPVAGFAGIVPVG